MILTTGATGNVGRPLIEALAASGARTRAVSRDPDTAGLPPEVSVVPDASAALGGATALFINPRAVGAEVGTLLARAAEHGARRVVALSAVNVEDDLRLQPSRFRGDLNKEVEDAVTASGLPWVILRASWYAPNTIGLWAQQTRAGDVIRGPYAEAAEAPVDPRDVAAVAAVALDPARGDDLVGRRIEVTGPESLTQREMLGAVGAALGRELRYEEIPPDAARRAITGLGFPSGFADANLARLANSSGRPASISAEASDILGRPLTRFADWARANTTAFGTIGSES